MNWDLTSYFPAFDGPEMRRFKETLWRDLASLRARAAELVPLGSGAEAWAGFLTDYEDLLRRLSHLGSYVGCLAAADGRNESYLREERDLARLRAESGKVRARLLPGLRAAADEDFSRLLAAPPLEGAGNYLTRLREEARRAMDTDKEILATDLGVDGIQAWGRLYDTMTSKLEFQMAFPSGERRSVPMSQRRSLMEHSDRRIRRAAFEGGNDAWARVEDVAAAALNAISGTRLTLNRHRGIEDFLEPALFQAAISRETLEAMFEALFANLETARSVVRFKAGLIGERAAAWYDLAAPLPLPEGDRLTWDQGASLIEKAFTRTYPALGRFVESVIENRWIDWEPRPGKRPGGFCTTSLLNGESRIFMTYNNSLGDVLTLAHECGHAYHGYLMRELRPYARMYPMTLAETASTFGELLLCDAIARDSAASDRDRAMLLDAELGHAAVYLLDIPVRFEFEKSLHIERRSGELGVSRMKELMVETQRRIFGDALAVGGEDPYFWASKLHFYITGLTFYNFPYTFGFLLSRALYTMYRQDGESFFARYEEFLRQAGSDTAERVVRRTLRRDLQDPAFWEGAIRSLSDSLSRLEALLTRAVAR